MDKQSDGTLSVPLLKEDQKTKTKGEPRVVIIGSTLKWTPMSNTFLIFLCKSAHFYTITIDQEEAKRYHGKYRGNGISTTKYNFITFIPKNLFEQFSRVANIYFGIISLFQLIPGLSPTGRFTTVR